MFEDIRITTKQIESKELEEIKKIIEEPKKEKEIRKFAKCLDLIGKSNSNFQSGDEKKAKRLYAKALKAYLSLDYAERKTITKSYWDYITN